VKQQISANFAQAEVEHLVTVIPGEIEPCRDADGFLMGCPDGQFLYRVPYHAEDDCTCRYEMRHCDNEFYEWNILTGQCECVERACLHDNHHWDFNECGCVCDEQHTCENNADGHSMIWDRQSCSCICTPEESGDARFTWNFATCKFECIIGTCEKG